MLDPMRQQQQQNTNKHKKTQHVRAFRYDDDVLTIGLNRAVALLAEPRRGRGQSKVLRSLGDHPDGGLISIKDGRYGPYVTHKGVNATLPASAEPDVLTLDEAVSLLQAKVAKGKSSKKTGRKRKMTARSAKSAEPKAAAE